MTEGEGQGGRRGQAGKRASGQAGKRASGQAGKRASGQAGKRAETDRVFSGENAPRPGRAAGIPAADRVLAAG